MKFNQWTLGLAAVGAVSLASAVRADEAKLSVLNTALSNTTISGYVDVAAQYNMGNAKSGDNFSLNSATITLDKPLDESPWAAGYHVDLNGGSAAITPLNSGGSVSGTVTGRAYGDNLWVRNNLGYDSNLSIPYSANVTGASSFGIRQAYVALRTPVGNGIDWKMGLFDGITGYEGNTAYLNPNFTRSYGYALNPASEVGLLGAYNFTKEIALQMGIANRVSGTAVGLSSKDYIAALALTAPESFGFLKGSVLNLQTIQTFDNGGINNYSVNGTFATPVAGLKFGLAYDKVQSLQAAGADGNIYGVYATYQATQKLGFNLRGEYLDGQNLSSYLGGNGGNYKGEEVTATIQYDLWANVVSRLEFRWDHLESNRAFYDNSYQNAYLLALNIVYKF